MGHVMFVPSSPSTGPFKYGYHGDKNLSQRKSSKQLLFPCEMTAKDCAIFDRSSYIWSVNLVFYKNVEDPQLSITTFLCVCIVLSIRV